MVELIFSVPTTGDFAVLLSAGMSVKTALLANFLSACSCFIGLVFGILISEIDDVNLWIFAATGGFFIYIALTNMVISQFLIFFIIVSMVMISIQILFGAKLSRLLFFAISRALSLSLCNIFVYTYALKYIYD